MTISLEKIFFAFVLKNKRYFHTVDSIFFRNKEIETVYKIIRKYMLDNSEAEVPSPKQILEMVSLEDKEGIITKEILKAMLTTDLKDYDEQNFIIPKLNAWILTNKLKSGAVDIIDETRSLDQKTDFDSVMDSAYKIRSIVDEMSNINFADDEELGSDFDDAENHVQDTAKFKVKTGFDTIDHMLGGGWDIQTLNVLMAETNNGKCFFKDTQVLVRNNQNGEEIKIEIDKMFSKISKGDYNF
jgi:replicative DNA helicase